MMTTLFFFIFAANATVLPITNSMITNPRQLTFTGPRAGEGYFSADGTKMIFQSEREPGNPFYQIFLLDLDSGKTTRLSTGEGKTTCGWIHPDGKKVMWSSTHADPEIKKKVQEEFETRRKEVKARYSWSYDEHYDIYESDLQGKRIRRLTTEKGYDAEGSYSPDGRWIAFASNRAAYTEKLSEEDQKRFAQDPSYMMDIYIMRADGSQVRRLTTQKGYDGGPFFSPDGRKITWRRFSPDGSKAEIFTMNVDGSEQKQITRLGSMSWAPFFHPSGDYVIFTTSVLGYSNFELYIVDANGASEPVRASFNPDFDGLPTFTPDGHQVSWTRRNAKGESQIYIADWDDAQARKLLSLPPRTPHRSQLADAIDEKDLRAWVQWLADERFEGRPAGGAHEKALAEHFAAYFKSLGFVGGAPAGGFLQPFEFTSRVTLGEGNSLQWTGSSFSRTLSVPTEAEPYSLSATGATPKSSMVFVGYGLKAPALESQPVYDSYRGVDVQGKWVVLLKDLPEDVPPARKQHLHTYARLQHKVMVAREAGAVGVLVIDGLSNLKSNSDKGLRFEGTLSSSSLPVWRMGGTWIKDWFKSEKQDFDKILKDLNSGKPVSFASRVEVESKTELVHEKSTAYNVIARSPGKYKGAVLIGAHGDHLGAGQGGSSLAKAADRGKFHVGADDNASGVAAVMELAQHFSRQVRKPGKDVYFAIWSAEEIGVLGSKAFVDEWQRRKKRPFKDTFWFSVNMDMIGRLRSHLQIQGVGSGDHWTHIAEEISIRSGLPTILTEDPYLPTDAMTFYLAGIPSVSFFTGAHSEYHTPLDRPETLNYPGLTRITHYLAAFVEVLRDSPVRMVSYRAVKGNSGARMEGRSFRIYLGTIPDYAQEGVKGVRISGVSADSPAAKAGLREKDVIVEFAGSKIENIYDYVYALQSAKAGVETSIKVVRGEREVSFKILPITKE